MENKDQDKEIINPEVIEQNDDMSSIINDEAEGSSKVNTTDEDGSFKATYDKAAAAVALSYHEGDESPFVSALGYESRAQAIIDMGLEALEAEIKDCGLFRNKAKNIMATCRILVSEYQGQVPEDFEALLKLPGVGRKTANVVSSIAFNRPAIAVDTHVFRVANRLKLAVGETPLEVEKGLMKVIPRELWSQAHHWLIWHGRRVCKARKPLCDQCPLVEVCPSAGL